VARTVTPEPAQEGLGRISRTKESNKEGCQETLDKGDRSLFKEERRVTQGAKASENQLDKSLQSFSFWLVAAWVCPGRSTLQSAEQWCQRRYGHKHQLMIYIIKMLNKNVQRGHQVQQNHP